MRACLGVIPLLICLSACSQRTALSSLRVRTARPRAVRTVVRTRSAPARRAPSARPIAAAAGERGSSPRALEPELRRLLDQPERSFSLERTVLLLARGLYPDMQIEETVGALDAMTAQLRERIGARRGAAAARILRDYLFSEGAFRSTLDLNNPRIRFLPWVVERRSGQCLSLTTLFLVLADRLKIPLHAAELPGHVFPRYDDGRTRFNIETLEKGRAFSNAAAAKAFGVSPAALEAGVYLRNMTRREFASAVLTYRSTVISRRRSRMDLALAGFNQALSLHPRSALTWNNRGNHFYRLRQWEAAIADFRRALKLDPNFYKAYCNLASAYHRQGRHRNAVQVLEQAVTKNPGRPTAYYNLGIIYDTELGNKTKALYHYGRFLEVGGKDVKVRKWMVEIVRHLGPRGKRG